MDYFHLSASPDTIAGLSSLGLAHLGDGVYELMVRSWLCLKGKATNKGLHKAAITYVSAPAQAQRCRKFLPVLTEEEQEVFRRGRNSHTAAVPKGASVGEYHTATAMEALFGYLWLKGETDRLNQLFTLMMED
ncbi:MAG: ribonuclease III domain-containing protein [Oscillospiraceae bacterium]|nr:ribonuclease III domain-containing protein [Oscillospiraceae bacterium]